MLRPTFSASSPRSASRRGPSVRRAVARTLAGALAGTIAAWTLLGTPGRARATGGEDVDDYSSFFAPEIIATPEETPFFLTYHALYPSASGEGGVPFSEVEAVNTREWSAYFRGKVSEKNLAFLIYKMKLGELDKLIWALEGKRQNLSKESAALKAELEGLGNGAQALPALYYLGFAKRCEPIALRHLGDDAWDAEKLAAAAARDAETAAKLLAASQLQLAGVADKFLKERYQFQRLRLMFYTGRCAEAERYYADNIAAFTTESSIKYRFISTAAGCFYHDKNYGQANYLYSLVFGHFAPLKRSAYLSFRPVEEADWKACLGLARSDRERTVMWQLLGIYADGLAAIEKIYALAPDSNLLPLLLVREVNKAERDLSTNESLRRGGATDARAEAEVVGKKRLALVKRIADEKKALKPYLWQLAVGYLYALKGDAKSALAYLDLADKSVTNTRDADAAAQIRMSRLYVRVRSLKAVDKTLEPYLATELSWLKGSQNPRAPELKAWALGTLSKLYRQAGDTIRALLLLDDSSASLYSSNRRIDALMEFLGRPGKSPFDEYLAGHYGYSKGELLELKAVNELYAGRFKSAAELLSQAGPELGNQKLRADPFLIHIVDCHDCDFAAKGAGTYTKAAFFNKLLELSTKAERPGSEGAQASFQLANGLYNMSYYGNARDVYGTAHSNFYGAFPFNLNMQLAEKYYKRALELSADKEFKAKACFMAAKTEQNRYFNAHAKDEGRAPAGPEPVHSPVYFKLLKDSYANTRYYQEIIKECGYFRNYLKR